MLESERHVFPGTLAFKIDKDRVFALIEWCHCLRKQTACDLSKRIRREDYKWLNN